MLKECPDTSLMKSFWIFEAYSLGLTSSSVWPLMIYSNVYSLIVQKIQTMEQKDEWNLRTSWFAYL